MSSSAPSQFYRKHQITRVRTKSLESTFIELRNKMPTEKILEIYENLLQEKSNANIQFLTDVKHYIENCTKHLENDNSFT